jgi:transportin-1
LEKICEDSADRLDRESPELVSQMLQQIVALSESPNADIRASVVNSVNQFLLIRSNQVWNHLDSFLQILYNLTNDSSLKVKRYVCQAFNHILELDPEVILPVLNSVVEFMLVNTLNEDKELALEAADFWLVFCEQETMHIHLQQFLPRVVPILLTCMIYTEDDLYMLEQQGEDFDVEDKDQDIKPRFHKGKTHELSNNQNFPDEDEEDSDLDAYEDYDDEWNVRKSSAAALDTLSTVFGDDFLPDLLPKINEMLQHPDWKTKEASILAIGAIAQGCVNGMIPHLPGLIPHLINLLNHEKVIPT